MRASKGTDMKSSRSSDSRADATPRLSRRGLLAIGAAFLGGCSTPLMRGQSPEPDAAAALAEEEEKKKLPKLHPEEIAVNLQFPRHKPSGSAVLRGARVITMRGDEVIDNGTVVVDRNRITAVGANVAIPPDAKVIDVAGKTIMPGIIDVHWHGSMGSDELTPQQSWVNYATLAFGVTTELEMQGHWTAQDRKEVAEHDDIADIRSAGMGITAPGGHPS